MDYHDWLTEIDEREYEADNAAWEFALLCSQTDDLRCPTCGYPVDVLDEAIVCPVCPRVWKSADEFEADWTDDAPDEYSVFMAERAEGVAR